MRRRSQRRSSRRNEPRWRKKPWWEAAVGCRRIAAFMAGSPQSTDIRPGVGNSYVRTLRPSPPTIQPPHHRNPGHAARSVPSCFTLTRAYPCVFVVHGLSRLQRLRDKAMSHITTKPSSRCTPGSNRSPVALPYGPSIDRAGNSNGSSIRRRPARTISPLCISVSPGIRREFAAL